ncbi:MAG: chemotaxis protein CheW [Nitrospirota bacterium]|nr:chemotaxis protein CheW [Nitrospirota bacterium]
METATTTRHDDAAPASRTGAHPDTGVPDQEAQDSLQLITFSLGEELFALDILKVQEIIRVSPITPVPHTPDFVDGVLTLRGKIVPVIDLRTRLSLSRTGHGISTRVVVTNVRGQLLGLVVDRVHEVARLPLNKIESAATAGAAVHDYVHGVGRLGARLVTLLDIEAISVPLAAHAA